MAHINLNSSNFEATVLKDGVALIDCWASWCGACKEFGPVFDSVSDRHPQHTFAKLDTQAERELSDSLGVSHIPTLILFRDGLLLLRQPGYFPEQGLDDIIAQAEGLDMDQVRAEMAREEAAAQA